MYLSDVVVNVEKLIQYPFLVAEVPIKALQGIVPFPTGLYILFIALLLSYFFTKKEGKPIRRTVVILIATLAIYSTFMYWIGVKL